MRAIEHSLEGQRCRRPQLDPYPYPYLYPRFLFRDKKTFPIPLFAIILMIFSTFYLVVICIWLFLNNMCGKTLSNMCFLITNQYFITSCTSLFSKMWSCDTSVVCAVQSGLCSSILLYYNIHTILKTSKDEFDSLQPYMQSLTSPSPGLASSLVL